MKRILYRIDDEIERNPSGFVMALIMVKWWLKKCIDERPRRDLCAFCQTPIWNFGERAEVFCSEGCMFYGPASLITCEKCQHVFYDHSGLSCPKCEHDNIPF